MVWGASCGQGDPLLGTPVLNNNCFISDWIILRYQFIACSLVEVIHLRAFMKSCFIKVDLCSEAYHAKIMWHCFLNDTSDKNIDKVFMHRQLRRGSVLLLSWWASFWTDIKIVVLFLHAKLKICFFFKLKHMYLSDITSSMSRMLSVKIRYFYGFLCTFPTLFCVLCLTHWECLVVSDQHGSHLKRQQQKAQHSSRNVKCSSKTKCMI